MSERRPAITGGYTGRTFTYIRLLVAKPLLLESSSKMPPYKPKRVSARARTARRAFVLACDILDGQLLLLIKYGRLWYRSWQLPPFQQNMPAGERW